jgi:hypothetical protein
MTAAAAAAVAGGLGIVGSLVGANQADKASQRATRAQVRSSQRGQDLIRDQFGATQEALNPFIQGAGGAFERQQALSGALGEDAQREAFASFQESPNIQFLRDQGMRGINQQASARGGLGGGSRLKALSQFNQNLAQQDFNNQFNRLGQVSRQGLSAAQALGGFGSQQAAQQANLLGQQGQAQAQGHLTRGQAFQSGLSGIGQGIGSIITGFTPQTNTKDV